MIIRPMRHLLPALVLWSLALPLTAWAASASEPSDSERFKALYEKEWAFRVNEFPMLASGAGDEAAASELGHVGELDQQRRHDYWKGIKAELKAFSCDRLSREECINFRLFSKQINNFIGAYETRSYLIPFTSDSGFYMDWNRLPEQTDFTHLKDYRAYLSRLQQIGPVMDEYIGLMRAGIELGFTQPQVILQGRDEPIKRQLVERVDRSAFFAPFVALPDSIADSDRAALQAEARQIVSGTVIPAYQRLYDFFHQEYVPGARKTLGAHQLPGGEQFYRSQIRLYATVDMSPAEIHAIGLSEVARIRGEMESIIAEVGFDGDFSEFVDFLRTDPQFYAKTPRELLAAASYFAKKIDGRLPMLFGHLPRQPYGIAPVPEDIAPFFTSGRYAGAPQEAHRGGYYWVNTHGLQSRPLFNLPALTLHEGAPGHHIQGALSLELQDQPAFRRNDYISAYGEGWGLYAEKLGVEMGIYETPYENFGRLTYEMWRACRLVIDTGIHAMGWTREQAQQYLAANTALSLHEITTEIDRYISWPAQALSYKLGEYRLWQLRREAEQTLGGDFDVRAFHDFVLGLGSVTLDILQDEVRYWIRTQEIAIQERV